MITERMKAAKHWIENQHLTKTHVASLYNMSPRNLNRGLDDLVDREHWDGFLDSPAVFPTFEEDLEYILDSDEEELAEEEEEVEYKYVGTLNTITIYRNSEYASVDRAENYDMFQEVLHDILDEDLEAAWQLLNPSHAFAEACYGAVEIKEGEVYLNGFHVNNVMTMRLKEMLENNSEELEKACKFFEHLMRLEDEGIIDSLFDFLKHNGIELNEDGTFTGYRAVQFNYMDKKTGKISNHVGAAPTMPRSLIDKSRNVSCSRGLHVGSLEYAKGFAYGDNRVIRVVVRPEDVVSVPYDYNGQKMRTCGYTVVEDVTEKVFPLDHSLCA